MTFFAIRFRVLPKEKVSFVTFQYGGAQMNGRLHIIDVHQNSCSKDVFKKNIKYLIYFVKKGAFGKKSKKCLPFYVILRKKSIHFALLVRRKDINKKSNWKIFQSMVKKLVRHV